MKKVIFDLDGTLADITHRLHYVQNGKKDWVKFFANCADDKPIPAMVEVLKQFKEYEILIVTGRSDEIRAETEAWLVKYDIPYSALFMRKDGDYQLDYIVKQGIAKREGWTNENVLCVFEDRKQVVEMWRRLHFTVLQVAKGDF